MARSAIYAVSLLAVCLIVAAPSAAQDTVVPDSTLPDSAVTQPTNDSTAVDSTQPPATADSMAQKADSLRAMLDSLKSEGVTEAKKHEEVYPPIRLIDSLKTYFIRHRYAFDVQTDDMFPQSAADFLVPSASFYVVHAQETPLRTTVAPYGLTGSQMTARLGAQELAPNDRTASMDGMMDFNDIATGDVVWAGAIEGPLSGFNSLRGGAATLYLEPFVIPTDEAHSQFTVERGAYSYAYTRGRIARTFAPGFGLAISTDYRTGAGYMDNTDDNSYNVITRLYKWLPRQSRADFYLGIYRRTGGYAFYRRLRMDQQLAVSLATRDILGGQVTGSYNLDLSRSADPFKTIKPRNTYTDLAYLRPALGGLIQASMRFGREQYYINQYYASRYYGFGDITGFMPFAEGRALFFARVRDAENVDPDLEGAVGYEWTSADGWRVMMSVGRLVTWPDLTDLYEMQRQSGEGYPEIGNPLLRSEKKLTANATLTYRRDKFELSGAVNTGRITDLIYYDHRYQNSLGSYEITPENDRADFADFNLAGSFRDLWLFYARGSATIRTVRSDRYGDRPPYSPRWQISGEGGLKYHIAKYDIDLRAFSDITYTENPLSYTLEELPTVGIVTLGMTANLKHLTFYYMSHNFTNQRNPIPYGYGYSGWYYTWGINFRMLN
jgi:hypothetical protein